MPFLKERSGLHGVVQFQIFSDGKTDGKKVKKEPDPRVRECIANHCRLFLQKFSISYLANYPKEGKQFKNLINRMDDANNGNKQKTLDEIFRLQQLFFDSRDKWIKNSGYTVGAFVSSINKLRIEAKTHEDSSLTKEALKSLYLI